MKGLRSDEGVFSYDFLVLFVLKERIEILFEMKFRCFFFSLFDQKPYKDISQSESSSKNFSSLRNTFSFRLLLLVSVMCLEEKMKEHNLHYCRLKGFRMRVK